MVYVCGGACRGERGGRDRQALVLCGEQQEFGHVGVSGSLDMGANLCSSVLCRGSKVGGGG